MAATSVTGKGIGSADKRQKGSEHLRVGTSKLIGPRPMAVGTATLDGSGNATVVLPAFDTAFTYIVLATDATVAAAAAVCASIAVVANTSSTITLKGTAAHVIQYGVFKVGLAV